MRQLPFLSDPVRHLLARRRAKALRDDRPWSRPPSRRPPAMPLGLLGALLIAAGVTVTPGARPVAAESDNGQLRWSPCGEGFECATAGVPLDYDDPHGPRIRIALIRMPATDQSERIGSLFINPGGPGVSGVDAVRGAGELLPALIRARFDVVGFDPRGVARSTPLRCSSPLETPPPFPFPMNDEEEAIQEASDRRLAQACLRRGGRLMDHMSTANVARDLDMLRATVGDDKLHYFGVSYGSYLGMTYANLFPHRVGAMAIDAVADPVAWSTGRSEADTVPFTTRLRSDKGARETLGEFFRLCDEAGPACAFSGGSETRFAALAGRARTAPIPVPGSEGDDFITYAELIAITLDALHHTPAWPAHAAFLAALDSRTAHGGLRPWPTAPPDSEPHVRRDPAGENFRESSAAVACADSDNPSSYGAWPAAADAAEAEFGYFGRPWAWESSICAVWPGRDPDRYTGPWGAATAHPILIVGNLFDPATPYHGAVTASELLPNSRLLTYAGWGHSAFASSPCVSNALSAYLISGELPSPGSTCPAGPSPFSGERAGRAGHR
jgi:pimeloyl-ACP methyl ester carboxylesterase